MKDEKTNFDEFDGGDELAPELPEKVQEQTTTEQKKVDKVDTESLEYLPIMVLKLFRSRTGTIMFTVPKRNEGVVFVKGAKLKEEYKNMQSIPRGEKVCDWDNSESIALNKLEVSFLLSEIERVLMFRHLKNSSVSDGFSVFFEHFPKDMATTTEFKLLISEKPGYLFSLSLKYKTFSMLVGITTEEACELKEGLRAVMYSLCVGSGERGYIRKSKGTYGGKKNNAYKEFESSEGDLE